MAQTPKKRVFLLAVERSDLVSVIEGALRAASIPFESALQAEPSPMVVFVVAEADLDRARVAVAQYMGVEAPPEPAVPPEAEERSRETEERLAPPHGPFKAALGLVLLHIFILITFVGPKPTSRGLAAAGGLVRAEHAFEPWRLITSLAVHADVRHLAWNALSLIVFAVPVIQWVGYPAAVAIYLAAGLAGGVAALAINPPGTVIVGSSGAIAGLFGAWLAITLRRARRAPMTRREIVRAVGIALLVLPTLLNPVSDSGRAISVEAHVGGALAGLVLGAFVRRRGPVPLMYSRTPEGDDREGG